MPAQTRWRATPHHRLWAELPLGGEAKEESCRAASGLTAFAPNTKTFSAVHKISVGCRSRLARSPGGLGGRSRIEFIVSPLSRRRHNESHFAAQSPERAFLAKPFFARAKNGVNLRRRSRKISVSEAKCNICRHKRAGTLHLIRRLRRHLSRCGSVRRGSWFPPGTNSIPRPCFAALGGEG